MIKKIIIYCLFFVPQVNADDKVNQVLDVLKTACSSGEKVEIKTEGNGGISLESKTITGKLSFSKNDFRGISEGLNSEDQTKNLESVRECMKPYVKRIIDLILGDA